MSDFNELINGANILVNNKNYENAIQQYTEAIEITSIPEQKIDIYNTIGRLHIALQNIENGVIAFEKSLYIHNSLPEEKAQKLIVNKATILNNLGVIYLNIDVKQAIKYHKEALGIFTKESKTNPEIFTLHLANTHYSYGDACYQKKDYFMAKKQFKEAIKIYESVDTDPLSKPLIANSHYNLGNIYTDEDNVFDARNNYLKSLKLFRSLTESQPEAYRSLVAATFNNLAVTAKAMYKYTDAITYYENALEQYKILIDQDRETFLPFYAGTLNSIGVIYTEQHEVKDDFDSHGLSSFSGFGILSSENTKDDKKEELDNYRKEKAVDYYQQAVKIYNELADQEPDIYTHYVATALHNLGVLHDEKKDYSSAEKYYAEALNIRRFLAKEQPDAFNLDVCVTLLNLTTMYQNLLEQKVNIQYKTKALKLLKEIEERLSVYGDSEKPVILSMKSDTQYFTQYFKEINNEYLEILDAFGKVDEISEKIKETIIPSEKLKLQKNILNQLYLLYQKYPKNERLQIEMLNTYTQYSWLALRSNEISIAEKAFENGFKIDPDSLNLKANQAHLHLVKNEIDKAKEIYLSLKDLNNEENESFKKVLEADLTVLKNDGILKQDIDVVLDEILA